MSRTESNLILKLTSRSTVDNRWDEFYIALSSTTANENGLGCRSRGRMRSVALVERESPRMSLTLDAVENNGLSPSLRSLGLEKANQQRERMALFQECSLKCAREVHDTADIVREAMLRQL